MFSSRLPADLAPTPLARAMATTRQSGDVIDLTESNPTRAGFAYPDLHAVFASTWISWPTIRIHAVWPRRARRSRLTTPGDA